MSVIKDGEGGIAYVAALFPIPNIKAQKGGL
jgi:hypothetical protein